MALASFSQVRGIEQSQRDRGEIRRGTATIGGVVRTAGDSPSPIRRTLVTLSGGMRGHEQTMTDDLGRFVFAALPPGRYTLTAEKPGWVKTFHGSRRIGQGPALPLAIEDGGRISDIAMTLVRGAVIAGRIVDELGGPVPGAQVRVLQPQVVNGERRFVAPPGSIEWATSDDRGRYRIYGLAPGEYTVRSTGGGGVALDVRLMTPEAIGFVEQLLRAPTDAPPATDPPRVTRAGMFYPGVIDVAQAQTIVLEPGEERTGIDVRSVLVRSSRVEGVAVGPGGEPITNAMVGLANLSAASLWSSPGSIRPADPDGRWAIPSIAPGRYLFFGRTAGAGAPQNAPLTLWTELEVVVGDADLTGLVLQFLPGVTVSGKVSAQAGSGLDVSKLRVSLGAVTAIAGASLAIPAVNPNANGDFTIAGVPPGDYRLSVTGATGWHLLSAVVDGREVLDSVLEVQAAQSITGLAVTLTDRPSVISGTLFDRLGRPAPEYSIVVFSTDRRHWSSSPRRMSGAVKLGSDGRFSVAGLPAGGYYMAAVVDPDPASLNSPAFLEELAAAAIRIRLEDGERTVQDIRIGGSSE
jgi:hypothetical protein